MFRHRFVYLLLIIIPVFAGWMQFRPDRPSESSLHIIYRKPVPPDSIRQFLTICFKLNKTDVISDSDHLQLVLARMSSVSKEWMETGKLKELQDEAGKAKYNEEIWAPFKNNLLLHIFSDSATDPAFRIDSVHWQVISYLDLVKGDTLNYQTLKPAPEELNNSYLLLKKLADKVTASGLIR